MNNYVAKVNNISIKSHLGFLWGMIILPLWFIMQNKKQKLCQ